MLNSFDSSIPIFNRNYIFNKNSIPSLDSPSVSIDLNINNDMYYHCDSLKCFYNKTKNSADPSCFYLNEETIDFKFNFYRYISNISFDYKQNLSLSEIRSLNYFVNNNPFKICEADKNVGVCFMTNENYEKLCLSLLNDINTYEQIYYDPLQEMNNNIKTILNDLKLNKEISNKLFDRLFVKNNRLGSFRILTKLHKEEFGLRPIVNCRNHPTSNISLLIDVILQPFVKKCPSFLQDSQNLIQNTYRKFFQNDCKIYSCDFSSLYTSINLDHALNIITDYISRHFYSDEISTKGFHDLLKIIFEQNYFNYNNKHYKQKYGISMGNKAAPSIANIYVFILEDNFLTIYRPYIFTYYRYIDDIFIIIKSDFDIKILITHFGYLRLNVVGGKLVNFLDLVISLNPFTCQLKFNLYIKPTFTFSYVLPDSNHPAHIFDNIVRGTFIRVRRICTDLTDYLYYSSLFAIQFIKKGYEKNRVYKIARMVGDLNRDKLIPYKSKQNNFDFFEKIFFKLPFSFNYLNVEKFFYNYNKDSDCFSSFFENYRVKLLYSMNSNLSKLLIHNFKTDKHAAFKYHKCQKTSCKHCPFSNTSQYIKLNNFFLPIMCNSSCKSVNIIYILYCSKCFHYYIGETINFKERFNKHKRNILINNTEIDEAFNDGVSLVKHFQKDHYFKTDLKFFIFKTNITDKNDRLNIETQLMHLFLKLNIPILNDKIPDMFLYKKQIYLFN